LTAHFIYSIAFKTRFLRTIEHVNASTGSRNDSKRAQTKIVLKCEDGELLD